MKTDLERRWLFGRERREVWPEVVESGGVSGDTSGKRLPVGFGSVSGYVVNLREPGSENWVCLRSLVGSKWKFQ